MKNKSIYVITQFYVEDNKLYYGGNAGFLFSLSDAIKIVENNECDLFEKCYVYTVIAEFKEGIYQIPEIELWYEWDYTLNKYVRCDKPTEKYKELNIFAFSL